MTSRLISVLSGLGLV